MIVKVDLSSVFRISPGSTTGFASARSVVVLESAADSNTIEMLASHKEALQLVTDNAIAKTNRLEWVGL